MRLFLFFGLVLLLGSCSPRLTPLTSGLVDSQNWSDNELRRIQYYLNQDIVLERQVRDRGSEIVLGNVIMRDGRQVERLVFPRGTPGAFVRKLGEDRYAFSFEPRHDDRFLVFTANPKRGGLFLLSAHNWHEGRGQLSYAGNTYFTVPGSGLAALEINMKGRGRDRVRQRTVPGRTVR
jgi:hypothetical protein